MPITTVRKAMPSAATRDGSGFLVCVAGLILLLVRLRRRVFCCLTNCQFGLATGLTSVLFIVQ